MDKKIRCKIKILNVPSKYVKFVNLDFFYK
jgi:hypothetical protein